MSIAYSKLKKLAERIEHSIRQPIDPKFPAACCIRRTLSAVQAFGLDDSSQTPPAPNLSLPIIVAIGANYTQGTTPVPRKSQSSFDVEDNLSSCRSIINLGLSHYKKNRQQWHRASVTSSPSINVPDRYHLLMTNFCLWITNDFWTKIPPSRRADLLVNNPTTITGQSTAPGSWYHLDELARCLKDIKVLWIGHGMRSEVFALFRQFMQQLEKPNWILLPNVSRGYKFDTSRFLHPER